MKGKCVNLDCPEFDKIVDIPDGEDFVCKNHECGHKLHEVENGGGGGFTEWAKEHRKLLIIAASILVIVVLGLGIGGYLWNVNRYETITALVSEEVDTKDVVSEEIVPKETPVPKIPNETVIKEKDPIYIYVTKDSIVYKTDTLYKKEELTVTKSSSSKSYSQGKYSGGLKNGYPEGQGTMVYTKYVRIAKHDSKEHYAEAGYSLVGTWINGDISNGKLIDKNGNTVEVILAGARNSVYNLENDN
jgi:hypothetical protein